jgi:glutamate synthase domain-containing protein 3
MTGGCVVVLGPTGRNFAAGMSGGVAYVLDADGSFAARCNTQLVALDRPDTGDLDLVRELVSEHARRTGSQLAARLLAGGELPRFVKVMPHDFKRVLAEQADGALSAGGVGFVTRETEEAA